jgi:aryl-alcohol dehydrogenase-like predicted oxidoreductase
MERRPLGRTGLRVSVLGFGASPAAYLKPEENELSAMLNRMLDAGVNAIDTAAMYPGSEQFIGQHLSHRRKDYVLISKCGTAVSEIDAPPWSSKLVLQTIDRALKLLRTDVIDVMLLHTCDLATLQRGEALGALVEARNAGKIRHAGYSGDNEAVAWAAAHPEVAAVEMSLNIVDQINIDLGLKAAREHNVGVIVKRPVANACWKDPELQRGIYKGYSRQYTERLAAMKLTPAELGFSGSAEKAWPEIALRFAISFPAVNTAVAGTTNPVNAQANLAAMEKGPLPPGVIEKIRTSFQSADPHGHWRGLT